MLCIVFTLIPCSQLLDWSAEDVKCWLRDLEMVDVAERVRETNLSGGQLLTLPSDEILDMLQIGQYNTLLNFCCLTLSSPVLVKA